MELIPLKRVNFGIGLDPNGRVMSIPHTANELKSIVLIPGRTVIIQTKKSPDDTEIVTTEYPFERYFFIEYVVKAIAGEAPVPEVPKQ